jgi:ribonuclease Z
MNERFNLHILGSGSALPTNRRNPSAQLLRYERECFLIDCAEGTQLQLRKEKLPFNRIRNILISHMHGDHMYGLPGLLFSLHLLGKKDGLSVFGPPELKDFLDFIQTSSRSEFGFPLEFHPLVQDGKNLIWESKLLRVYSFPLDHSIETWGFLFEEKEKNRRLKKKQVLKLNLAPIQLHELKHGKDIEIEGVVYENEELTNEPEPISSFAYCSDTAFCPSIVPYIENVKCLYHEVTFEHAFAHIAQEKKHTTSKEAATIAQMANVERLLIGHFSARYDDVSILENECREIFPETYAVNDGDLYQF